jgi:hypothetical protein
MNVIVAERTAQGETKMKTYTIDVENNIVRHESRQAARDCGAGVFSTEEQFADLIGPDNKRLVEIFNSLPGVKRVSKFSNRKTATERIWKAIQQLGGPAAAEAASEPAGGVIEAVAEPAVIPAPEPPAEATAPGPIPAVETPFDLPEAKPIPQETASGAPTEPAVVPVDGQPAAAPGEAPEGTATVSAQTPDVAPETAKATKKATRAAKPAKAQKEAKPAKAESVREGSKTAQVVALLKRETGATLAEIMEKMAWQKHTVRGFMAGAMKKAGYTVESFKPEGGERTYRINS